MFNREKPGGGMADRLRWGIVAAMDETAPLILAWVAHHMSVGAELAASHPDLRFDPRPAMAALGLEADLSGAAFDAELRAREAALIAKAGLAL